MREIKLLVWNPHDKVMYDPMPIVDFTLLRINGHIIRFWTGLKDKNSKEIYEGDVIRKDNPSYWNDTDEPPDAEDMNFYRGGTAQVVAIPFGFYMQEIDCGEWCFNGPEGIEWAHYEIQVIGNIYENPELLKDETKS